MTLARALIESPKSSLRPVLLTDPRGDCRASVMPVVNDPDTLRSLVQAEGIRHAAVCLPEFSMGGVQSMLDKYSTVIPHLLVLTDTQTLPALWSASRQCGRLSGIEVRNGLLFAALLSIKRAIDVLVAGTVLILGLPVMLIIAGLIKWRDPGPVFFGHVRIGRHGKKFKAWKFRSMRVGGNEILREYLARNPAAREEWEATQKLKDDPRVTKVGSLLRAWSLDELPQLWNVLRGDMSLVGPRPIVDDEVRRYGDVIQLYARVKPGITGLWQVSGRNQVGYEDRVLLDQFYTRHWSPWLDVFVLAKTVITLITRDGAY
jgi:Undecaprenyl-phosphate galactose phosphotransferase WbaP